MTLAAPTPIPTRFSAEIGGYMGSSYRVELSEGRLTYTSFGTGYSHATHTIITPTEEQWREFRKTLDDLKLWQWRSQYRCDSVVDGTHWSLDIAYADQSLKTDGDNCYPYANGKPNGEPSSTQTFNQYLGAVQKLTGVSAFNDDEQNGELLYGIGGEAIYLLRPMREPAN